ncbi:glycosyltransferase [Prochlorococcus marinus]|uniref:glycosyltransferase n=1 Tax=Prochlorococcus marinus TaxID=1219 RepID=UPI00051781EC|nr:glycosyltransferase [Prochlorococcus marinus]|tara:strand:- start:8736 stop:9938 length:1203 start_codon:yes stop_codon:yes gene_type:complete
MNILFITPCFEPAWSAGGVVTSTKNLCIELARQGSKITIYTTNFDGNKGCTDVDLKRLISKDGINIMYFKNSILNRKAFYSSDLIEQLEISISEFDIVNISACWQLTGYIASRVCKKNSIPYIITPHSSLMADSLRLVGNKLVKIFFYYTFLKNSIKNATKIHYLSEGEKIESDKIKKWDSFVISNGTTSCFSYKDPKRKIEIENFKSNYKLLNDELILLYLGRIHPKKNLDITVKTLALLIKKKLKVKLLIVGNIEDSEYATRVKILIKKFNLNSNIIWLEGVPHHNVYFYYNLADILILNSSTEGVSMSVIEALSERLPILGSYGLANFREIIAYRAGIICELDPPSIAKKLEEYILNRELLQELSVNSIKLFKDLYEIKNVAKKTIIMYQQIKKNYL